MENLSINDSSSFEDGKALKFSEFYNDPSAGVILTSNDGISFRVHDYYLKAVSPVFKDMLSLATSGGAIGLPDDSKAILVVLDYMTKGETENKKPNFHTMVAAFEIAKRFDMKGTIAQIKERLHGYSDGPRMLALACQQVPIDRPLARSALSLFADRMFMDNDIFRSSILSAHTSISAVPYADNWQTTYLESLTTIGCTAFLKAMDDCRTKDDGYDKCWDWGRVAIAFVKHLNHYGR